MGRMRRVRNWSVDDEARAREADPVFGAYDSGDPAQREIPNAPCSHATTRVQRARLLVSARGDIPWEVIALRKRSSLSPRCRGGLLPVLCWADSVGTRDLGSATW